MEHHFLGHSSAKFPRAMEVLKKVLVFFFFPDGMFQTEIRVPFFFKAIFDTSFGPSRPFLR